jgi:hypothetical protein
MNTQETSQERAEKYFQEQLKKLLEDHPKLNKTALEIEAVAQYRGFVDGERITLERLAAKSGEGLSEFIVEKEKTNYSIAVVMANSSCTEEIWQARGIPLLAKIELLEKRNKELESKG